MGVSGDFSELDELIGKLDSLESGAALRSLANVLAEETLELVAEGFEFERDPYGAKWAALRSRDGRTLQDTGALRNSFHVSALSPDGFTISAGVWYAVVHQTGKTIVPRNAAALVFQVRGRTVRAQRVRIPARPMLPNTGELPPAWKAALERAADEWLDAFMAR